MAEFPQADLSWALAVSLKALNDALRPEGNVPSALVFVELPLAYMRSKQESRILTVD